MMHGKMRDYLSIGQVLRPQGLKGIVKIRPDTDDPGRFLQLKHVYISIDNLQPNARIQVSDISVRNGYVYLRIEDDQDIEAAERRRGLFLYVSREDAVPLEIFENYIVDMIGCKLIDQKQHEIGTLIEVLQPGANDVYLVETKRGKLLIPALQHVILEVDVQNRKIYVDENHLVEVSILAD